MRRLWDLAVRDWNLKLTALAVALLLWAAVKSEELVSAAVTGVPVGVSLRDPRWQLASAPSPARVTLQVTGPVREILRLAVERPRVLVPVEDLRDSVLVAVIRSGWVQLAPGLDRTRVDDIQPAAVRLVFDPVRTRDVPVALPLRGALPAGLRLSGPLVLDPSWIRVSGPWRRLSRLDSVRLPALDLRRLTDTTAIGMDIDTAGMGLLLLPTSVRVRVPVARGDSVQGPADSAAANRPAGAAPRDTAVAPRPHYAPEPSDG
jgi:YbbR domain-containing protein